MPSAIDQPGYTVIYGWFYYFLWTFVKFGLNMIVGFCELVTRLFSVTTITHSLALNLPKFLWLVSVVVAFIIGYGLWQTKYVTKLKNKPHLLVGFGKHGVMFLTLVIVVPICLLLSTITFFWFMNQMFTIDPNAKEGFAQSLYMSFYNRTPESIKDFNVAGPNYGQYNLVPTQGLFDPTLTTVPANHFQLWLSMFVVYLLVTCLFLLIIKTIYQACVCAWSLLVSPILAVMYYQDKTICTIRLRTIGVHFVIFLLSVGLFLTSFKVTLWIMNPKHVIITDFKSVFASLILKFILITGVVISNWKLNNYLTNRGATYIVHHAPLKNYILAPNTTEQVVALAPVSDLKVTIKAELTEEPQHQSLPD